MICKICNQEFKGNIGLSRHLSHTHKMSYLKYSVLYDNFEIPKCVCGKNTKYKDGLKFNTSCGDEVCVKKNTKRIEIRIYERES